MTEEIKEILNLLKRCDNTYLKIENSNGEKEYEYHQVNDLRLDGYHSQLLLDYITNLQQDLDKANDIIEKDRQFYKCRMDEYGELKKENERLKEEKQRLLYNLEKVCEEDESPYCEICGTCGYIGCCGIRNFISEHIEGKTNCKNESLIISELINLCEYKDEVFEECKDYKSRCEKAIEYIKEQELLYYSRSNDIKKFSRFSLDIINILNGSDENETK